MESSVISLIMVQGPREGETLDFPPGSTIRIGRVVRGNSVTIKDSGISTKHFSIESEPVSGKWILRDLDSSNGTFLNGTKLPPHDVFALSDGDTIKLGEWTSISIKLNNDIECRSRRNPRRQAAEKGTGLDVVGSVAETRGRRGKVLEEVGVPGGGNGAELESGRCLRPRKGRALKCETTELLPDCKKLEDGLDVGRESENPICRESEPNFKISKRSTRRVKNDPCVITDSVLGKVPENSCLDGEVKAGTRKTRAGTRGRKNVQNEPLDCNEVKNSTHLETVEQKLLGENTLVDENQGKENVTVDKTVGRSGPLETHDQDDANVGIIPDSFDEAADGIASRDKGFHCMTNKAPDLKKMTLGEWFDYLEIHLPKQIIDATDEIISDMRIKSAQVNEYILQQKNERCRGV